MSFEGPQNNANEQEVFKHEYEFLERMEERLRDSREGYDKDINAKLYEIMASIRPDMVSKATEKATEFWYQAGILTEEEQKEFEKRMGEDPKFREEVEREKMGILFYARDDLDDTQLELLKELMDKYPDEMDNLQEEQDADAAMRTINPKEFFQAHDEAASTIKNIEPIELVRRLFQDELTDDEIQAFVEERLVTTDWTSLKDQFIKMYNYVFNTSLAVTDDKDIERLIYKYIAEHYYPY